MSLLDNLIFAFSYFLQSELSLIELYLPS